MSANPTQPFQVKIVKMVKIVISRIANTPPSPRMKIVKIVVKQMSVNPTHPCQVKSVKIVKIVKSRKANTSNQFRNSRKYWSNWFYDLVLLCIFFCPTPGGFYEVPFLSIQQPPPPGKQGLHSLQQLQATNFETWIGTTKFAWITSNKFSKFARNHWGNGFYELLYPLFHTNHPLENRDHSVCMDYM